MVTFLKFIPLLALAIFAGLASNTRPAVAGGGGCYEEPAPRDAAGTLVLIQQHCFSPTVLRVEPGAEVEFRNNDSLDHNVWGVARTWGTSTDLGEGDAERFVFDTPGVFPYNCFYHPGMSGAVVVGDGRSASAQASAAPRSIIPAAAQVQAREAPADADGAEPLAAAVVSDSDETNALAFAGLGALIGAVVVGLAFGARELRRP